MSELDGVWRVELSGIKREIAVTVTAADRRTVTVDGRVIVAGRRWGVGRDVLAFDLDGHRAEVTIPSRVSGLGHACVGAMWAVGGIAASTPGPPGYGARGSSLRLDGRYVAPLPR